MGKHKSCVVTVDDETISRIVNLTAASAEAPSEPQAQSARSSVAAGSGWVRIEDGLPQHMERVLATYVGVYGHRLVTYWWDGHRGRFGLPTEADERGPQPATHWHRLPPLPNGEHEPRRLPENQS